MRERERKNKKTILINLVHGCELPDCPFFFAWWKKDGKQSMLANWVSVKWIQRFPPLNRTSEVAFVRMMSKLSFVQVCIRRNNYHRLIKGVRLTGRLKLMMQILGAYPRETD